MSAVANAVTEVGPSVLDVDRVRADFPILTRKVHGKPLIYLDNGASAQKPQAVIDATRHCWEHAYANVHRGLHTLSGEATDAFEAARNTVARHINADSAEEVVFTKGATEAINLVAASWAANHLGPGDAILISEMEHHANIVPWQLLCERTGIELRVVPVTDAGELTLDAVAERLDGRVRLVAVTHTSNVLGTVTPAKAIARLAHDRGALVLFDGSQAAVHGAVDVQDLDADFYTFTGHKLYGPTGIGVLYGRRALLDDMPPYQGGGEMIHEVRFEGSTFAAPPHRFEAGTPPIVEAIGLAAAIDYVNAIGFDAIAAHEADLLAYATERLAGIDGLTIHGQAETKAAIVSFTLAGAHASDIGTLVDRRGVAIRTGHHCAQPLMRRLGVEGTARASFALYNTRSEIDVLVDALERARRILV